MIDGSSSPQQQQQQQQQQSSPQVDSEQVEWGTVRKRFAAFLKQQFDQEFGAKGELLTSLGDEAVRNKLKQLESRASKFSESLHAAGNLGELSPWLRNFKRNFAKDLEM